MDKCINTFKKVVSSDNFLQLQRKKINFPILTIKADQICEEILRHSLHVKNIVQRKGETKNFRVFSNSFSPFTDHPFSRKLSSIILRVVTVTREEAIKSYERRNYVLYDGEEKGRRMRRKRKRMSKRTNRPFPPKGRKNRLKYSTRSLGGGRSNGEKILKKNLLRVSQLRGNREPLTRSAI